MFFDARFRYLDQNRLGDVNIDHGRTHDVSPIYFARNHIGRCANPTLGLGRRMEQKPRPKAQRPPRSLFAMQMVELVDVKPFFC